MYNKKLSILLSLIIVIVVFTCNVKGKSVYSIIDHGYRPPPIYSAPAKIAAYGIDGDQITLQEIFTPDPNFYQTGASHGPIDLAVDSDSAHLFVTYEGDNFGVVGVEVVNAKSMTEVDYVPAPGASDLAANMWTNEAELNGDPNVDDDGNGLMQFADRVAITSWLNTYGVPTPPPYGPTSIECPHAYGNCP